jgi:RNA polymerase sigma factor (TIGR02999 family)
VTRLPRSDTLVRMSDVTSILNAIAAGDAQAADQLLPEVYAELRKLAAAQMANEKPGHTLDATALVHEAWLRLAGNHGDKPRGSPAFASRRHFFAASAEAMRRILVDYARAKKADKRGGGGRRFELSESDRVHIPDPDTLLAIDEVMVTLAAEDPNSADIARLRLFAGLSVE